jgi:hypothetical protein
MLQYYIGLIHWHACVLSISDLRTVIVKFYIFFAINILVSHKTSIKTRVWEFQIIQGLFVSSAMHGEMR